MVITRWNSMGGINLLEWTVNPFQTSTISKLQDFFGLSYEDLFDVDTMKDKWVKAKEIEYIVENRDLEFAKKSTIGFELRDVQGDEKFQKLQNFYGFTLEDTQDTEKLVRLWMSQKDILYITGKDVDKKEAIIDAEKVLDKASEIINAEKVSDDKKWDEEITKQTEQGWDIVVPTENEYMQSLRDKHKEKFGKYPSKNIKKETLIKKLWVKI